MANYALLKFPNLISRKFFIFFFRLYALSRPLKAIPDKIIEISNFHPSRSETSLATLMKYRIIVVTLVTAGKLASAGFPKDHFTHLFIDEAGHATEPEAMVALSGVLAKQGGMSQLTTQCGKFIIF